MKHSHRTRSSIAVASLPMLLGVTLGGDLSAAPLNTGYNYDARGGYMRFEDGCVKTERWTPALAVPECDKALADRLRQEQEARERAEAERLAEEARRRAGEEEARRRAEEASRRQPKLIALSASSGALFAKNSSQLTPEARQSVVEIADKIRSYQELDSVTVTGHTDSTGDASYNQWLSEQRANRVRELLVLSGLSTHKITSSGRGETQPVADNRTREGRAKNRRVEIEIRGKREQ